MISQLDRTCAKIDLGKGYSPLNLSNSTIYSGIKFLFSLYKNKLFDINVPNFSYDEWYKEFLFNYLYSNDLSYLSLHQNELVKSLNKKIVKDELGYLLYTKLVNVDMLKELLN